eukprot:762559-Hanusia_phi.AAC.6
MPLTSRLSHMFSKVVKEIQTKGDQCSQTVYVPIVEQLMRISICSYCFQRAKVEPYTPHSVICDRCLRIPGGSCKHCLVRQGFYHWCFRQSICDYCFDRWVVEEDVLIDEFEVDPQLLDVEAHRDRTPVHYRDYNVRRWYVPSLGDDYQKSCLDAMRRDGDLQGSEGDDGESTDISSTDMEADVDEDDEFVPATPEPNVDMLEVTPEYESMSSSDNE